MYQTSLASALVQSVLKYGLSCYNDGANSTGSISDETQAEMFFLLDSLQRADRQLDALQRIANGECQDPVAVAQTAIKPAGSQ